MRKYRQIIGSLLYLTISRHDIAYSINVMARYIQKPYEAHLNGVNRILKYLKGTSNLTLEYSSNPKVNMDIMIVIVLWKMYIESLRVDIIFP